MTTGLTDSTHQTKMWTRIILCCDGLYLITLQPDKRGFLIKDIKESTLQSAKDMHPTLIYHISAKIKDIRLIVSQDGALTKKLYNFTMISGQSTLLIFSTKWTKAYIKKAPGELYRRR